MEKGNKKENRKVVFSESASIHLKAYVNSLILLFLRLFYCLKMIRVDFVNSKDPDDSYRLIMSSLI